MKTLAVPLLFAPALCCVVLLALFAAPALDDFRAIEEGQRESARLDAVRVETLHRLAVRAEATAELVAGRIALAEAITRTRGLGRGPWPEPLLGESEDERLGLALVGWAEADCPDDQRAALVTRLRAELRDHLEREMFTRTGKCPGPG